MGISDKDYADAIERQRAEKLAKILNEGTVTLSTVDQPYGKFKALTEQDLKNDAMKAPLSALVDMWTVRWGSEWVSETEFQEDDFWRIALVRLTGANKLEKHNLASQYKSVYRVIE
jgi:hypothetical protein